MVPPTTGMHITWGSPRSSTTPCWPRLKSSTTAAPTSSWAPPAVNTSACAPCPSPILEIRTSSARWRRPKHLFLIEQDDTIKFCMSRDKV
ncbi:uncharacterized protein LOC6732749 isoform X2 [Drosophila simulans]|uniref:Uncharacterized protein LOC117139843 isoform X2 n=1 Tax=Drosophila mauritiana TaxID=7226 RepID=A0A6P8JPP6_DROMA|nr:uncharacterized protein LOC117139843 isoform X2 [Drosophila mauritiana]XP_044778289.1 uncharacterized protein LOC6732749 isoform X2 [Drosophila simulans]